jgi:uncharacterized protein YbbC (DUF1343 family)
MIATNQIALGPDTPTFRTGFTFRITGMPGEIAGSNGLNIGIHTEFPFQFVAVAWLDANKTCQLLNNYNYRAAFKPMPNAIKIRRADDRRRFTSLNRSARANGD